MMQFRELQMITCAITMFFVVIGNSAGSPITVEPEDTQGADGIPEYVHVHTNWYKLRFTLSEQGSAESMVFKPLNHELRAENYYSNRNNMFRGWARAAEPNAGTGVTRKINSTELRTLTRTQASYQVKEHNDRHLVIAFRWRNTTVTNPSWFGKLAFERTLTFRQDTPLVEVIERVTNEDDVAHPILFDVYNSVGLGRVKSACYLPDPDGKQVGIDIAEERGSRFIHAPEITASWIGGVNEQGLGGAFSFDWADIDAMEINMWKTVGASYYVAMRRRQLEAGQSLQFRYTFLPVTGMSALDGMAEDLAGGLLVGKAANCFEDVVPPDSVGKTIPVRLHLFSGLNRDVRVALTCIRQDDNKKTFSSEVDLTLKTAERVEHVLSLPLPAQGLYVLQADVYEEDKTILTMRKPITAGRTRLMFTAVEPTGEKRGTRDAGFTFGAPTLNEQFRTIDRDKVTPHETWLKQHANGAIKAMFLTPADSTLGHVREITQRADMPYDYFAVTKIQTPRDALNPQELRRFQQQLTDSDAKVLCTLAINWQAGLKQRLIARLLDRVREDGLGVVLFVRNMSKQPLLGQALEEATRINDTESPLPSVAIIAPKTERYQLNKGRIAIVTCNWTHYRDGGEAALGNWKALQVGKREAAVPEFSWRGFEYSYARLAQLMRWAAGQDTTVTVQRAKQKGNEVTITLLNRGGAMPATMRVMLRTPRWQAIPISESQVTIDAGQSRHVFKLPDTNHAALEVTLLDKNSRTIAFGAVAVPGSNLATLSVEPVIAYRKVSDRGSVTVQVKSTLAPTGRLVSKLIDRFGREVLSREDYVNLDKGKGSVQISLEGFEPRGIYHELVVQFYAVGKLAEATGMIMLLPEEVPFKDRMVIGMADGAERRALHIQGVIPTSRELGITMHTHNHYDPVLYASGGVSGGSVMIRPTQSRYLLRGEKPKLNAKKLTMEPPLAPDESREQQFKKQWQARAKALLDRGAFQIHIDDERRMSGDFDYHPQTLARFRQWLTKRYNSIEALNKSWQTSFASFDEVMPKTRSDLQEGGSLAPWLVFRMFIGDMLGEYYMRKPAEWAAELGDISVGEMGIYEPSTNWPVDWSKYAGVYKYTCRYGGTQGVLQELFRSFAPNTRHGRWMGYGMREISGGRRINPWNSLLHGGNFIFYWAMVDSGYWNYGVNTSDQRPTRGYAALAKEEFPDLTGGIDQLIIASQFIDDDIAIAYSYPSWLVSKTALASNVKLVTEELGYQHRYASLESIENGELQRRGDKVLILQNLNCISANQANAIEQFAKSGGVVLAFGNSGQRDLNGALHSKGNVLDGILGIDTRNASTLYRPMDITDADRSLRFDVPLKGAVAVDAQVMLGTKLDGQDVPILTRRNVGSGSIYWLNVTLHRHQKVQLGGVNDEQSVTQTGPQSQRQSHWLLLDRLIRTAGIEPRMQVRAAGKTERVHGGEAFAYQSPTGRSMYLARYISPAVEGAATVSLKPKGHIYDLRQHKYLGSNKSFDDAFGSGRVNVYAVLPYAVRAVDVSLSGTEFAAGGSVKVTCRVDPDRGQADMHALRLNVIDPAGNSIAAHQTVLLAYDGKASCSIPLALNAATGKYRVQVMDVASGLKGEASFVLK